MKKQLLSIITALALTLQAGTGGILAAELPEVGSWSGLEITTDEQLAALDYISDPVALDSASDPSAAAVASLSLQQQLERKQQRAAAAEGEISAFALGDSADDPFYISNAAQLAELATLVNDGNTSFNGAYYKLTKDMDLSAYAVGATVDGVEYTTGWTPIGTDYTKQFFGTFDGQNHKITNLTINSTAHNQGLFGYVFYNASIQNLGVENASIAGGNNVGGVAGYSIGAVSNCYATGSISGLAQVGGVVGRADGAVTNCYATASVTGTDGVGGVVGWAEKPVSNCYATGSVSSIGEIGKVGGVVGGAVDAVSNCVALNPSVSGKSEVGAVAGSGTVNSSYYWGSMRFTVDGKNTAVNGGSSTALTYNTGLQYGNPAIGFAWTGFTDTTIWNLGSAAALPTLKDVGGTQSNTLPVWITHPKQADLYIFSAAELAALATAVNGGNDYADKTVLLMNDIDLSGYGVSTTHPNGWTPIGIRTFNEKGELITKKPFAGKFDGQDCKITNLTIQNREIECQGLFGFVTGQVQNLGVENVNITGYSYLGGLVGAISGTSSSISNCYVTGSVSSTGDAVGGVAGSAVDGATITNCYTSGNVKGYSWVGGVAGEALLEDSTAAVTITKCYSTASVSGVGTYAGGLIGEAGTGTFVIDSYATGSIVGLDGVGGLIGNANGTVSNCYATGSVVGFDDVGGVAGQAAGGVTNCVALNPAVGGNSDVGAVVGFLTKSATTTSSYYWGSMRFTVDGKNTAINGGSSTALTYNTGLQYGNPAIGFAWTGFTDTTIWNLGAATTLPTLKDVGGTQSSTLPVWITDPKPTDLYIFSAADLAALAAAVNGGNDYADKTVLLMNDIDLSAYAVSTTYPNGWTPIGTIMSDAELPFAGTFDGQGYKITNLTIQNSETEGQGLFGFATGKVQNLGVENVNITGKSAVGGVVGYAGGAVSKCYVTGNVNGVGNSVGGVVGFAVQAAVSDCYTIASVSGMLSAGGVVGMATDGASVTGCYATGNVTATQQIAGGVVGFSNKIDEQQPVTISNCYATGSVSSVGNTVGGVVGWAVASTKVVSCYATGDVQGAVGVGGVAGYVQSGSSFTNCYATGSVTGTNGVGGVVGFVESNATTVQYCYATGNVLGAIGVGGVAGGTDGFAVVADCVALNSTVASTSTSETARAGAVLGLGTASDCFYWVGMTGEKLVKPATGVLTQKDGKLMYGDSAFGWTGYSTDNIWTIPTEPLQLPYLSETPNRVSMPLSSAAVITHTVTLEYPTDGGELYYSLDNMAWTEYTTDVPMSRLAGETLTVYVMRAGYGVSINGSEKAGQWSGKITGDTTLTPTFMQTTYALTTDATAANLTVNNHTGEEREVVVVIAEYGSNDDLLASYVQAHRITTGENPPITWTHRLGSAPANTKVFILEPAKLAPLLAEAAA